MGVNSLPKTVTRQRRDCDLNPGPSVPESSTLTTRLPSHPYLLDTFQKTTPTVPIIVKNPAPTVLTDFSAFFVKARIEIAAWARAH